jgi:DhnA family fructose-bisphosphate aldolase class Ia
VEKSLDLKLARIHADPHGSKDFILADAKDADMALAIGAPGRSPEAHSGELRYRSLAEFRDIITQIVEAKLVDIMLMAASTSEVLTIHKRLFDNSPVTPAARANDTTDIHIIRGSKYPTSPSLPFRTATLDHIQCGHLDCKPEERHLGANLGLYSITFNNDTVLDRAALEEYKQFRLEAERKGFRHFLEVFDPNRPEAVEASQLPGFINDAIVRTLGGVTSAGRPLFLKMVYHGPQAMEELVHYDPHLIVGILGGSAGTTYDAFKLLSEAKKYGARVALFGRKINNAENQLAFIRFLRLIADGEINAEEAVRAYHGVLQHLGIKPYRSLNDDMVLQTNVMSYGGNGVVMSVPPSATGAKKSKEPVAACTCKSTAHAACACPDKKPNKSETNGTIDFTKMTAAQKVAYHKARWDRILG